MPTLLLLRHAKSSRDDPGLADHERPLARRGEKAARRMGRHLAESGLLPDLALCSTARRALDTWRLVAAELGQDVPERLLDGLYLASPGGLLRILRRVPDGVGRLLVVGHSPGLEGLALRLATDGPELARLREKFPTAALAVLELEGSWAALGPGRCHLARLVRPRDL